MPVSVVTDGITWAELIAQILVNTTELSVLTYLVFFNGWLDMLRKISFFLDNLVIKYIDKFYSYFDKLLNGRIFTPEVIDSVMSRVYVFVTIVVLIKVLMLFMKYVINPEMFEDQKIGAHALVKRVIIGMALLLLMPVFFDKAIDLQGAIISDNIFGKVFLSKSEMKEYDKNKGQLGRILGFNVYQAFWSLDTKQTDSKYVDDYNDAIANYDPSMFGDINTTSGGDYVIDYFPIVSTVILGYVLILIIKYCIDVVVRMFKLFVLELISPFAVVDYMINGDSKEMFKSWLKTTLSAYAMLFMRIFSIWFIAFVVMQMNKPCTDVVDGVCQTSLLYTVGGNNVDYLVRALVCIGLLAFLMDLPKLLSSIFGLDLEQDASVKGLMQKVGGAAKMVGLGAIAAGGAALGGAVGGLKQNISAGKEYAVAKRQNRGKIDSKLSQKGVYDGVMSKANTNLSQKLNAIDNNSNLTDKQKQKQRNQAVKEARQEKNAGIKEARKAYMKENAQSEEVREYKASMRQARLVRATKAFSGAGSVASGALKGIANATPVLRDAMGGYNQGRNSNQQANQNIEALVQDMKNNRGAYKKGLEDNANEVRNAQILNGQNGANTTIPTPEQINTQASIDATNRIQSDNKAEIRAEVTDIDTSRINGQQVDIGAKANGLDTSRIDGQQVNVGAKASQFDTSGVDGQQVEVGAKATGLDTSAINGQQVNVEANIEEHQFDEHQDG